LFDNRTDEPQTVGYGPCFFDLRGEPFGCTPVESLAAVDEVVEGADCFLDGRVAVWAVGVQDVDVRQLEALEGGFGGFDEVFAGEAKVVDFVAGRREGGVVGSPVDL
jgi:hypothetical protein